MLIIKFSFLFADEDLLTVILYHINLLIKYEFQLILFTLFYHYPVLFLLLLYGQVLFTFCDMITIFVNDYSEIDPVLKMILD